MKGDVERGTKTKQIFIRPVFKALLKMHKCHILPLKLMSCMQIWNFKILSPYSL